MLKAAGPSPAHVAVLRRLLEAGADPNRTINASGKKVLADGAHVKMISCAGMSKFRLLDVLTRVAVTHDEPARLEALELAVLHGANVNYIGNHRGYRWAAIHIAVAALDQTAAELLVRAGADLTIANVAPGGFHDGKRGNGIRRAPVHQICRAWTEDASDAVRADLAEFLSFLVEKHGADINLEDKDVNRKRGGTSLRPLQLAMIEDKHELAAALAKLGGATPDGWAVPPKAKKGAAKGKKSKK